MCLNWRMDRRGIDLIDYLQHMVLFYHFVYFIICCRCCKNVMKYPTASSFLQSRPSCRTTRKLGRTVIFSRAQQRCIRMREVQSQQSFRLPGTTNQLQGLSQEREGIHRMRVSGGRWWERLNSVVLKREVDYHWRRNSLLVTSMKFMNFRTELGRIIVFQHCRPESQYFILMVRSGN